MVMSIVRLCCGQSHSGPVCPDGRVMCCICFRRVTQEKLIVDDDGYKWDVCLKCREHELEMEQRREV